MNNDFKTDGGLHGDPPFTAPQCSASCPDYWIRYEMKDGEEVLTMSENLARVAVLELFGAIDAIKVKMTLSKSNHDPS